MGGEWWDFWWIFLRTWHGPAQSITRYTPWFGDTYGVPYTEDEREYMHQLALSSFMKIINK